MLVLLLLVLLCVVGSAFFSLAEASLYSISRARIETLRRQGHRSAGVLSGLRDNMDEPIAAILIGNTAVNTGVAALIGAAASQVFEGRALWAFTGAFALAVLIVGEIVPKNLGFQSANVLAPYLAWPVRALVTALWPLIWASKVVTRMFGSNVRLAQVPKDDIISLADMSLKGGGIRSQEARWVVNALHLDKLTARDIMTPALVVMRVAADMPLKMAAPEAEVWRYSRLPVFEPTDDAKILGVVERRKVFQELVAGGGEKPMSELSRPAVFVEETLPAHTLLDQFIKQRTHLFCVRDLQGRWTGIVTLEDVLEALLGQEIVGEQDLYEDMQQAAREARQTQALAEDLKAAGALIEVVPVEKGAALAGKSLKDAALPSGVVVGTIMRRGLVVVPHGKTRLMPGDRVTLIGKKDDVETARRGLTAAPVPGAPI